MANYTQAQLDALRAAATKGVRTVEYDGQRVTYNSLAEILQMISIIERDLSGAISKRVVYGAGRGLR